MTWRVETRHVTPDDPNLPPERRGVERWVRVSTHRTRAAALAALPPGPGYRVVRWYHAIGDRRDRPYSVWVGTETTPRAVAKIKQDLRTVRRAAAQLATLLGVEVRIEDRNHKVVERITK